MAEMHNSRYAFAPLLGLLLLFSSSAAWAGKEPAQDQLIRGEVMKAEGGVVKFTVLEGDLFRIRDLEGAYDLGLKPEVLDEESGKVRFTIYRFEKADGRESLREEQVLEVVPGISYPLEAAGLGSLQLNKTEKVDAAGSTEARQDAPAAPGKNCKALSLPISSRLIRGDLTLSSGKVIKFTVLEGGMFKTKDLETGEHIGLTPVVIDGSTEEVRFTLAEISEDADGRESVQTVGTLDTSLGRLAPIDRPADSSILVTEVADSGLSREELRELRSSLADAAGVSHDQRALILDDDCCMTCGSPQSCGCAVQAGCGSCCDPPCCEGGGGGPPLHDT